MSEVTHLPRTSWLSPPVQQLQEAVAALREQDPVALAGPQALTECAVLLHRARPAQGRRALAGR